ncbi:divisome protein SepX/GlpR [Aeromicrobium wangtongii]|uniref:Uncharacterized protein n=1 Tax=Aeromicrobium wangtongii TaxID=2969247 RepID=A0ABY5M857_9ACTN|nr:hypothetical protein [Aeromicrobium wangtongii]MCD9196824.1 hypothetical protein [Aeromicrobium wangtongii]UUP14333.1 hypothetical protein NQV15_03170 [Aeromicrobium wangtongii]
MGSSSGLIIAFVVVVWAAYFIPLALRRYDEASKNASVETTGTLSRVISRPKAAAASAASAVADAVSQSPRSPSQKTAPAPRSMDRPAARLAAKRRRRTLLTLLALTAIVGAVAGFGVIAPYWVAAPVALVVAWLVACRIQVRGERGISREKGSTRKVSLPRIAKRAADKAKAAKAPKAAKTKGAAAKRAVAADEEDTVVVSGLFEDIDPGRKHEMENVPLEDDALDDKIVIAVPSISTAGEALWDPLPVTLPTYVTKPRAGRTVRTIDFSQPHTWTSGHIEGEDVELPGRRDDTGEERRAVGH